MRRLLLIVVVCFSGCLAARQAAEIRAMEQSAWFQELSPEQQLQYRKHKERIHTQERAIDNWTPFSGGGSRSLYIRPLSPPRPPGQTWKSLFSALTTDQCGTCLT